MILDIIMIIYSAEFHILFKSASIYGEAMVTEIRKSWVTLKKFDYLTHPDMNWLSISFWCTHDDVGISEFVIRVRDIKIVKAAGVHDGYGFLHWRRQLSSLLPYFRSDGASSSFIIFTSEIHADLRNQCDFKAFFYTHGPCSVSFPCNQFRLLW